MSPTLYSFLHVAAAFLLVGYTFFVFASPKLPENRRKVMIISGLLSLVMLFGGFGLVAKIYDNTWHTFLFIKIACWLGLSAMAGIAYRKPQQVRTMAYLTRLLVLVAVWAVYFKPFLN
ncbi:MAG: hypothetical protein GY747_00170 [Planctomycetes bacterium]|nr:hypothetical protein [Planctomycetota bacterium]MCP4861033.1 hypothetical protein [Planctomycetota bacterium]